MTLIRRDQNLPVFSNFFNDFFYQTNTTLPSVNIKEGNDGFVVEVAAPGLEKEDFKISIDRGVLNISSEKSLENESKNEERFTRREFSYQSFCRSFSLPDSADSDKIGAKYENGILYVSIPKREEAKPKPARTIEIE